jgi:hypothetical protein
LTFGILAQSVCLVKPMGATGCISGWGRVLHLGPDFVEAIAQDGAPYR